MSEPLEVVSNFATIGELFEDGVSLIFDGQEEATEKHYRVNTSIVFKAGDRVKILADSGTYVVEYVVGPPKQQGEDVCGIPAGGTAGQALIKETGDDFATVWGAPAGVVPSGGDQGQILKKSKKNDYAMEWADLDSTLPAGGSAGQVLKKNSAKDNDAVWGDIVGALPAGGTAGQCLIKDTTTNYDASWGTPSAGSIVNQYRPTIESYNIYLQTDYSGNFYIRQGSSGTWKKITVV